jgi:hypothetical protein
MFFTSLALNQAENNQGHLTEPSEPPFNQQIEQKNKKRLQIPRFKAL